MISDGKLSHYFPLSEVKNTYVPNTRIIQKTISKHQTEAVTTSEAVVHKCS